MKAVKSLFAKLLLVAALVFAMTVSASADEYAPAVFKTTPFDAVQNGTVSTVLYLEENSNLIDFEFQLEYDTEFVSLQSVEQVEDLIGDMTITEKEGAVHISYTRTSANLTKKTDLAVLTFAVDENVGPESYDFLRVDEDYQSEAHTMLDGELYVLPIETEFAPLNIYNFGDVDLSHTVSIADVTYLRQHLAEIRTLSDYQLGRADTYYDTSISIADAVRIQQYLANKSMLLGNRVNVTFMDKDGAPYRVKSVVQGSGLASIPALPTYTGYYGGVWSIDPDEVVGSDFQNLTQGLNVYAIYKKDASQAVTFYKERLTDVYYAQSELTGNLNLVNKLTWQDGYTADIYWSSSNSAVLNASTGVYSKPSFDTSVTLTATIISYQDGSIEAQDYIAFEFNAAGDFLCPTKEAISVYLQDMFIQRVENNMILPTKITNADMAFDSKFEVRLSWLQQNADGTEQSVVQLERGNNEQTVNLTAIATFNGQPLEDDGKIYFDNVVIAPITISEVRSHIVTRIASTSGLTVTEGLELLGADDKYATTIVWESKNTKVADVDDNIVHIKDVVNGTALPLTAHVSYECAGEAKNFDLAYTVNVVTDNTTLVPGTNIDPDLYDALKSATGVSGNLTTDALKDVKFVYLDLSGYPEIEDLSALTYCTNLRVLNISGLQIDETSLNQIVTLNKLEALIASNCGIDSLTIGGVPVLDKMINLQMLDLSHNKLTSLDGIFSRDNRYGQLLELFLHDNELTDISALCEVVENTVELKDSEGNVTGTYTENVIKNRAPMLRFLTLDNNYLGDEDLTAFGNFKVLKYLSLGHNNISSVSSLKNVRTLLELHLQDNRIEDVRDLRYLDHLQSLYLSGNNIRNVFSGSKEVNVSYLKYLTDLEILYLDNNYIEDISDLAPLDNLLVLNANNNQLQDLSVLADKGETLVELYAENNDIDSFSFVRGLPNLTRLMLSGNGSVYEASLNSYLSGLTKLRTLTLSGKDLRSLSFLSAMPQLVRLDVAGCNLPSYTITSSENNEGVLTVSGYFDNIAAISALRGSLQYLDVSNNGLAYGADAVEQYLAANGKQVQVDSVAFAGAAPVTFESLYEMTLLKAFYADNLADPVDAKQLFSVMNGLRYLSMENCGITNTDWLSKFRSLIYLDLAGNQLAGFDLGSDIALRSRATLEYLYVDSAEEGEFANAYSDFDDNVLKEFSASNLQINTMESMPDMSGLTYLNLANSGITDLSGNAEFEGWYNLSRYANLQTLDLTGIQADLDEVKKLDKLQTMYAIGGVEDTVFQKQNLLTLYELDKAGVACYLYGYEARYLPRAEQEGGLILGRLEDYSRALTVAADGIICDNNPTFVDSVNNFEIEWTLSNNTNYAIVDNQIVVVDYTDLDDEKLIVTATIDVYPDQDPVSRDFVMDMDILRADNRLTGVAVAEGYELVLLDEQDNTVTQTTDTVNSVETDVYKNVVKMKLTINDATAREYVVMLLDGGTKVPGNANIRYIDQKSGPGALEFLVYPDQMTQPGDYTLMVFSGGTQSEAASFSVTEEPVQMFSLYNANMELGNSLTMYFYLRQADIQVDKDYYVTIAKTYADGRADVVKIIPEEDWISTTDGGVPVYRVGFEGIAAKEMADDLKVQVFTTDGRQASSLLTYNIRTYAMTMLYYFPSGELAALFVDMLNYGAAAQTFFKYNTDDLANAQLTTAQQALATQSVNPVNNRVVGPMYYNVSLQLESNILLQMYFSGIAPGMYARVSYTDHYGKQKTAEVTFEDFVHYSGDIYYINVEGLAVADGRQLVTCELYNENNVLVGRGTDSVESYIATMNIVAPDALYTQIMKFIDSAYRYFH